MNTLKQAKIQKEKAFLNFFLTFFVAFYKRENIFFKKIPYKKVFGTWRQVEITSM
jgi:hypothetical protein